MRHELKRLPIWLDNSDQRPYEKDDPPVNEGRMNEKRGTLSASEHERANALSAFDWLGRAEKVLARLALLASAQTTDDRQPNAGNRLLAAVRGMATGLARLTQAVVQNGGHPFELGMLFDGDAAESLRAEFRVLRQQFPDFGDSLFGLDEFDRFLNRTMADRETAADLAELLQWGARILEHFVSASVEVAMDPNTSNPAVVAVIAMWESVEGLIDGLADRCLGDAIIRSDA